MEDKFADLDPQQVLKR